MRFFYLTAFTIAIVDQGVKYLIRSMMHPGQSIVIIPRFFSITYVQNTGAAFGIFTGGLPWLTIIGLIVMGFVLLFHYRISYSEKYIQIALAFILGGSIGNMLDRIFLSYVVDLFDFKVWPAVFNIADMSINVGIAILIFKIFFWQKKEGRIDNVSNNS